MGGSPRPRAAEAWREPLRLFTGLRGQHGLKGIARRECSPFVLGGSRTRQAHPLRPALPAGLPQEEPGPSSVGSCQPGLGPSWVPSRPGLPGARDPGAAGVN